MNKPTVFKIHKGAKEFIREDIIFIAKEYAITSLSICFRAFDLANALNDKNDIIVCMKDGYFGHHTINKDFIEIIEYL